ncbi:serine/threonine-protein kinase [Frankia sp. R82]|uniref:serine/threonine-protein kinase n=1 Tax=Frankia sp. R82 TaxID=2950553 RepID=UPI0020443C05|nr:serine/threonine-protein kinase [Frankia sp. R82]MCM3884057.1 serine/threonine protein kinase [Frankia sp. R82]
MRDLEPGDPPVVGPYTLRARLGEGGMGRVFLAHSTSGRLTAVKLIRPELAADDVFRDRFRREVAAARRVSGAFTAPVVDADPDGPTPWLATQYVSGPSLHEAVAQAGPFSARVLRRLGAGLLEALIDVHRAGLVHRDLKPSNVLLATDGPRLIDFGIARAADHTELTRSGDIVGTAAYMSPEQASGEPAGPASDVFAFGAVLAFAATARSPFGRGAPASVLYRVVHAEPDLTGVPADLRGFVQSCLAKDPGDRPAPDALLGWLAGDVPLSGPSWPEGVTRLLDQRAAELNAHPTPPPPSAPPPSAPPPSAPPARPVPQAAIFPGRWQMFLAVGLILTVGSVGLAAWAMSAIATATSDAVHQARQGGVVDRQAIGNQIVGATIVLIGCLFAMPMAWWRLRYGVRRPALSISPHGIHAEVGGHQVDLGWRHIARADVIPLGRRRVLAVWPTTPGTTWALQGRRARRRPRGRYRCFWRHHTLGCDVIMDVDLLAGDPAFDISAALSSIPPPAQPYRR